MSNLMPDFTKENQYEFECGVCHSHFLGHKGRCVCDGCNALRESAESALAWLERWAMHVGKCPADENCTCGLVAIRHELNIALQPSI